MHCEAPSHRSRPWLKGILSSGICQSVFLASSLLCVWCFMLNLFYIDTVRVYRQKNRAYLVNYPGNTGFFFFKSKYIENSGNRNQVNI